ncbi:MAG: hypothetical protein ACLSVD_09495 [Eggerthellaceae bacterium]
MSNRASKPASIFEKLERYGKSPRSRTWKRHHGHRGRARDLSYIHDGNPLSFCASRTTSSSSRRTMANPKPNGYRSRTSSCASPYFLDKGAHSVECSCAPSPWTSQLGARL